MNELRIKELDGELRRLKSDMIFGLIWTVVMALCGGFILGFTEKNALGFTFLAASVLGVWLINGLFPEYRDLQERKRLHTGHDPVV